MPAATDSEAIVGRAAELHELRDVLELARAGRGSLVVLAGEAGAGKSTLATAIADLAATSGFAVSRGRAWEAAEAPAYFPVWSSLRGVGVDAAAPAERVGGVAVSDFHLWERALAGLAAASRERPALWLVEDIHAADVQTLDLLAFMAQPLHAMAAVVLVTLRTSDPRIAGAVESRVARLQRDGRTLVLEPLAPPEIAALARRHAATLSDADARELAARTGGNPLFVVECARALRQGGARAGLPPTVLQSVRERVARLPERTQRLLEDAAVLGNELGASTLGRMVGSLPARVIDDLAPALRAGILAELEPGRFAFAHALVRDAIDQSMSAEARSDAHARAADALAMLGDSAPVVIERAQHALSALRPDHATATVELVERAIELSRRQGAFDRAAALYDRVIAARRRGDLPAAEPNDLIRAGQISLEAGDFAASRRRCLEALALARAGGDTETFATAALTLGAELRPGEIDPVLVSHLEEALTRLPTAQAALRCRVSARLAAALQPARDPSRPLAMARQAIADARAAEDPQLLCETLLLAGSAMTAFADPRETRGLAAELLELATRLDDPAATLRALARLALDEGSLGDFAELERLVDRMLPLGRALGHPRLVWRPLLMDSMRALARGDFARSERLVEEVRGLARLTDDPALRLSLGAHEHMRLVVLDRDRDARAAAGAMGFAGPDDDGVPDRRIIHALVTGMMGCRFDDRELVAAAIVDIRPDELERDDPTMLAAFAEMFALVGTVEQCRFLVGALAPYVERDLFQGHIPMSYDGPIERIMGLLHAKAGDLAAAQTHLHRARERCRARGLRPWVARIGEELGRTLLASGRSEEAATMLAEAAAQADELGLPLLAARARSRLDPSCVPAQPIVRAPATAAALAMRREGDLWLLVHGDREIRVSNVRGMELLARLIERPCEEIHVLVLASDMAAAAPDSSAGEAIDARAARDYRARLDELDDEIAEAEANSDLARGSSLQREREFLQAELARAVGLGGTLRQTGSTSERARVNVRRRLKDAIDRIGRADASLGAWLRAAVRTGTTCTFRP